MNIYMYMSQSMNIRILKSVSTIIVDRILFNMQERGRSLSTSVNTPSQRNLKFY